MLPFHGQVKHVRDDTSNRKQVVSIRRCVFIFRVSWHDTSNNDEARQAQQRLNLLLSPAAYMCQEPWFLLPNLKRLPLKAYKHCVHRESRWHKEVGEVRSFCESAFKRSEILDSGVHALKCAELGTSHPALENQSLVQNTHIQDRARL